MKTRSFTRPLIVAAFVAGGQQLCVAGAQAQLPQSQAPAPQIADHKLDAAATALAAVNRVQQGYEEQLKRLTEDTNKAAEKAVTDQGLSVDEFKTIITTAQNDPDLRKKLVQRLPSVE